MSANLSPPPIASPHGKDTFPFSPQPDEKCARVTIRFNTFSLLRYSLSEWLCPFSIGAALLFPLIAALLLLPVLFGRLGFIAFLLVFVSALLFLIAFSAPIAFLIRLCCRRRFEIWISDAGLFKRYPNRTIFFPWSKFRWLIERGGDLWLASFMDGCFIPREAFTSRAEAAEFATIIRELKRTRGTVWRDKWNGRIFGAGP